MKILFEDIFNEAKVAVLITDVNWSDGPKVIYVNPKFENLTGYSFEEIVYKTPKILQGPKTCKENKRKIKEDLNSKNSYCGCVINYKKNGTEYCVRLNINKFSLEGEYFYIAFQYEVPELEVLVFLDKLRKLGADILGSMEN